MKLNTKNKKINSLLSIKYLFIILMSLMMVNCSEVEDAVNGPDYSTSESKENEKVELNKIKTISLSKPYSCEGSYELSAAFLTEYSKNRNMPDLLYNGACGSETYIDASTAGDDFTLIANLGDVPIEEVTAIKAFDFRQKAGQDNAFKETQKVFIDNTYVVLTSKSEIRSLVVYRVIDLGANGSMTLEYSILSYSIHARILNEGFSWSEESSRDK